MNAKVKDMFNQIIAESTNELQDKLNSTQEQLTKCENKCSELIRQNAELQKISNVFDTSEEVKQLFTEDNFEHMLPLFKLKSNNFALNGAHIEEVPNWFIWLNNYYEDRDKLFNLMDLFGVKYPSWAKNYKMPYDYSEGELELFITHLGNHYVCNGCIFGNNIGFFWERVRQYHGNSERIIRHNYSEIPWQFVLSNPRWATDKLFSKILDVINNKQSNSDYFFAIQDYTKISETQANEMIKSLPKTNLYEVHQTFIKNNISLIKGNPLFAEKFKDKICDNSYSLFNYLNYPVESQKEFIRSHGNFSSKMKLIKQMDIPDEDKIKFSMEFLGQTF